jgi:tripartite-type tricarboxylate transporter receptor subunit TctC
MRLRAGALAFAFCACGAALAQNYPVKPIRLVVVSAPGGTTDALARVYSQRLTESLGQALVVDNKPGGGGVIAAETVAHAAPDGYTLLFANLAHSLMATLHSKLTFDPLKDFTPVAFIGNTYSVLVTNVNLPVKTVPELIAYVKARPGGLNYAGGTTGATAHLSGELFKMMTGTNITHVPYKGTAAAITAVIAGEAAWNGILAPRGFPRPLVIRLNREFNRVSESPDVKDKALAQGTQLESETPEQFASFVAAQTSKWVKVAKAAGMRAD